MVTVEEYVCYVYGVCSLSSVSDARLQLFRKLYAPEQGSDLLKKIKASDPCCLPTGSSAEAAKNELCCICLETYKGIRTHDFNKAMQGPDGDGVR